MIIRIRGVDRVRAKGRMYYYHRASKTKLPGEPGTAEFMAVLAALEAKMAPAAPVADAHSAASPAHTLPVRNSASLRRAPQGITAR